MPNAVVVGAGQTGLSAARLLAERGIATTLVERLPAPGGQEPEGDLEVRLTKIARDAGVQMLLGTLAVRWTGDLLQALGVAGAHSLRAEALFVATGTRPATRAELGIAGDRCAGVYPATAAAHLLEGGVLLGHRPVVYGSGSLASRCCALLSAAGAIEVTVVTDREPTATFPESIRLFDGWRIASVKGAQRLSTLEIERGRYRDQITADALLLAAGRLPMRNIEDAISSDRAVVPCYSLAEPKALADAERAAHEAVARAFPA